MPDAQRRLWPELRTLGALGFVLYGGTAIALRLAHRVSVDFDFFADAPLDRNAMGQALPFLARSTVLLERPDTLTVLAVADPNAEPVKLSLFGPIAFGRIGVPEMSDDGVAWIASLEDLMATKLKVVLQRVEKKDYSDIAAMVRAGVDLARGLAGARALYGPAFQPSESLKAIVYFEGGDLADLPVEDRSTLIAAVSAVRDLPTVDVLSHRLSRLSDL